MGDLISRSALIKEIESVEWWNVPETKVISKFIAIIKQQNTAYNVDEVVEQLEKLQEEYGGWFADRQLSKAISIVKAGGINE